MRSVRAALNRPPGRHATRYASDGFCTFDFALATAVHALSIEPGIKDQGIDTDWDVRFDQGLMDILNKCDGSTDAEDRSSDVRYVSPRQVPHFPFGGQARGILEAW